MSELKGQTEALMRTKRNFSCNSQASSPARPLISQSRVIIGDYREPKYRFCVNEISDFRLRGERDMRFPWLDAGCSSRTHSRAPSRTLSPSRGIRELSLADRSIKIQFFPPKEPASSCYPSLSFRRAHRGRASSASTKIAEGTTDRPGTKPGVQPRRRERKDREWRGEEGEDRRIVPDGLGSMQFSRGSIKALGAISGCLNKAIVALSIPAPSSF